MSAFIRPPPRSNVVPIRPDVALDMEAVANRERLDREDRHLRVAFVWGLAACLALSLGMMALLVLGEGRTP